MRLSENSLYKDSAERAALVADKERCANSLTYNFFGFLSLYSLSEKKAQIKRYLNNEKDVTTTNKIGDDNLDVSLAVKLAVECGGLPERTATYMLKLLTKINQKTLLAKDIDDDAVRELIKYSKLQSSFKPNPALVSVISDFMDGTINLTFLAYGLFKVNKRFTDVNAEFVDYYKKGFYGTTYSDYVNGVIKAPDGVPQHLIKKSTPLTVVYTKNTASVQPQPQVQATTQQPAPVVPQVTPTPVVTPAVAQQTPLTVAPQPSPVATTQPTQPTPQAVVQVAPAITVPNVPVSGQKQNVKTKTTGSAYMYNNIVDIIEAGDYDVDLKKCDITGIEASFENFNSTNARAVAAVKKAYETGVTTRVGITHTFANMGKLLLAFHASDKLKQIAVMRFLAAGAYAENMKQAQSDNDLDRVSSYSIMASEIKYRSVKSAYDKSSHILHRDSVSIFKAFVAGTNLEDEVEFFKKVCDMSGVNKKVAAIKFYSEMMGIRDSGAAYIATYGKSVDISNLEVLLRLYIGGLYTTDSDLVQLRELFENLGMTDVTITPTPNGNEYLVNHTANPLDSNIVELTRVLHKYIFKVTSSYVPTSTSTTPPVDVFYSFVDGGYTVDVGGRTYTIEDYICKTGMYGQQAQQFEELINRVRFVINAIKTDRGVTIDDSDKVVGDIITRIFTRALVDGTHKHYSICSKLFNADSLNNVNLNIVKDAIEVFGNSLLYVDTDNWPQFYSGYTVEMSPMDLYAPKTPAASYFANKVAAALLYNPTVYKSKRLVVGNAIEIMTLKTQRRPDTLYLKGSEALVTASVLLTNFVEIVETGGVETALNNKTASDALTNFIQYKTRYELNHREELLSYASSVPNYVKIVEKVDSYIEGFMEKAQEALDAQPDLVTDIVLFNKHESYANATLPQLRDFKERIHELVVNTPMVVKAVTSILEAANADPAVTNEQFRLMIGVLGVGGGSYKVRETNDAIILDVLSNPMFKDRLAALGDAGSTVHVKFTKLGTQLSGAVQIHKDISGKPVSADALADRVSSIATLHGKNAFIENIFSESFNESGKTASWDMNTRPIISSPHTWSVLSLVDAPTREYMFKRVTGMSAGELRDAVIESNTYYTFNHDKLEALDIKKFGLSVDEAKMLLDLYAKFTATAFTARNEPDYKNSYKGVLIMIGKLESAFGIKAKYTKAQLSKLKDYGAQVVDFEAHGVTTKGTHTIVNAKFTLDDMLDPKFPIRPHEGIDKGSFTNAVRRNQPATRDKNDGNTLLPEFLAAPTHTDAIRMIFEGNVYEGNDSQKLAVLRPLCVTSIDATPAMLDATTEKLNSSRRERAHGLALPKVTKMFNVDFNMTTMKIKPHTKEAIDGFVASRNIDRNNEKEYLKVCFHGTGSMAASFILRFGFKDTGVVVSGAGNAGQMLGDGMYLAVNIDKAILYSYDGGVNPDNFGEKGYIFICEAALGNRGTDYEYAAPDQPINVRSREWCVKTPTQQVWIKRAYGVDIVRRTKKQEDVGNSWQTMPDTTIEY